MEHSPHLSCPAQVEWVELYQCSVIDWHRRSVRREMCITARSWAGLLSVNFSLLRTSLMYIRGARSTKHCPILDGPTDLQLAEGHLY